MSDDGFTARLHQVVAEFGGQNALARRTKLSQGGIARLIAGGQPTLATLKLIANATGRSLLWLAEGTDAPVEQNHTGDFSLMVPHSAHADLIMVPVLNVQAAAGVGAHVDNEITTGFIALDKVILHDLSITSAANLRLVQCHGDSMEPTIRSREWLLVDTGIDRIVTEGIYVFSRSGAIIVKRTRLSITGSVELISDNGGRTEQVPKQDLPDLHAAGRVVWVFRAI